MDIVIGKDRACSLYQVDAWVALYLRLISLLSKMKTEGKWSIIDGFSGRRLGHERTMLETRLTNEGEGPGSDALPLLGNRNDVPLVIQKELPL
jgi:hypothetical protein